MAVGPTAVRTGCPGGGSGVLVPAVGVDLQAGRARRCVSDRRPASGSGDERLSAMHHDGTRISYARTADDRLHQERTGRLWQLARNARAADRRHRPCGQRIHQVYREWDRCTSEVTVTSDFTSQVIFSSRLRSLRLWHPRKKVVICLCRRRNETQRIDFRQNDDSSRVSAGISGSIA